MYPHMWQPIPTAPVTEAPKQGVPLSAPNCIPVTLDKLPYFPQPTPAPTATGVAATAVEFSTPSVAVPAPTTPVNANITSNIADMVSTAKQLVSRACAGAAVTSAGPWGSMLHQQQLRPPFTSSNNPQVTAKHLSRPIACPPAAATVAAGVLRADVNRAKAAAVSPLLNPVTSAAALAHETPLATTATAAPTLSRLLQQALAHIPPPAAAAAPADTTCTMAEVNELLEQLASQLRSPIGPSTVSAAAAAVDASHSLKPTTSPLAISGGRSVL